MDIKTLNARIDKLGIRLANAEKDIQTIGLECLARIGQHGDVMPLNRLVNVLRKGQHHAFVSWALAYTKVILNKDAKTKALLPLVFAKGKTHDQEGAIENPWHSFQESKAKAIDRAFDLQAAVKALLHKASGKVSPETLKDLQKIAVIAHVDYSDIVAREEEVTPEPTAQAVTEIV